LLLTLVKIHGANATPTTQTKFIGLPKASSSLQSASKELEKGNIHGCLINTRNAVTNHLTQMIEVKEEGGNKRKRILKTQLRNNLLARVPTDAYNIYKKAIDSLQDGN
jgi:hypothetical protein